MTAAFIMPFEQIAEALQKYDNSNPKMDELKFVRDLQKDYVPDEVAILRRISEVRKMTKYAKSKAL